MNADISVRWTWRDDPSPPEPMAAVAWHESATRLLARLVQLPADVQSRLLASASREFLVVTGSSADLPWVPGIAYAVRSEEAPTLWRPTLRRPDVAEDLLARALRRLHPREPLLIWPEPPMVVPLDRLLRVTPQLLQRIEERWREP